jgi:Ca2+-binding RTX toxin-like protein
MWHRSIDTRLGFNASNPDGHGPRRRVGVRRSGRVVARPAGGPARAEGMEPRRLLAASIVLEGGTLTATGTDGADVMKMERVGIDDVRVTVNALVRTFDTDDVDLYNLSGLGGNDNISAIGTFPGAVSEAVSLNGGAGTDTLSANKFALFRNGEIFRDGTRTVATRQADGTLRFLGTGGADRIVFTGTSSDDTPRVIIGVTFHGGFSASEFTRFAANGGGGDDTFVVEPLVSRDVFLNGEAGNDLFEVNEMNRVHVFGGAGDDKVELYGQLEGKGLAEYNGGDGLDEIELPHVPFNDPSPGYDMSGDVGVENLRGATGTVIGNDLNNVIFKLSSYEAPITIYGRGGNDHLVGGRGEDSLFGEAGNDRLFGFEDDDFLDGGPGTDFLDGGTGNNTLVNGEESPGSTSPQAYIAGNRILIADGTSGADTFSVVRVGVDDVRITINNYSRTFDMDDFSGRILMRGGDGNDVMTAGAGVAKVSMIGERGNDRLTGNALDNTLLGGEDEDVLSGGAGDDFLDGGTGNDTLNGESGNDSLGGADGNDTLNGGTGNDELTGGDGSDTMNGNDGNDSFLAIDGTRDTLNGGAGTDRAQFDDIDVRTSIEQRVL